MLLLIVVGRTVYSPMKRLPLCEHAASKRTDWKMAFQNGVPQASQLSLVLHSDISLLRSALSHHRYKCNIPVMSAYAPIVCIRLTSVAALGIGPLPKTRV